MPNSLQCSTTWQIIYLLQDAGFFLFVGFIIKKMTAGLAGLSAAGPLWVVKVACGESDTGVTWFCENAPLRTRLYLKPNYISTILWLTRAESTL